MQKKHHRKADRISPMGEKSDLGTYNGIWALLLCACRHTRSKKYQYKGLKRFFRKSGPSVAEWCSVIISKQYMVFCLKKSLSTLSLELLILVRHNCSISILFPSQNLLMDKEVGFALLTIIRKVNYKQVIIFCLPKFPLQFKFLNS